MELGRLVALYIIVAVVVLGGAGALVAVAVLDVLRDDPAVAPATP